MGGGGGGDTLNIADKIARAVPAGEAGVLPDVALDRAVAVWAGVAGDAPTAVGQRGFDAAALQGKQYVQYIFIDICMFADKEICK